MRWEAFIIGFVLVFIPAMIPILLNLRRSHASKQYRNSLYSARAVACPYRASTWLHSNENRVTSASRSPLPPSGAEHKRSEMHRTKL